MTEPVTLQGRCLCGAVQYTAVGEPRAMFLCHCSRCRQESGSAHAANIFLADAALEWTVGEELVSRYALPGTRKARAFCSVCGSPVGRASGTRVVLPAGGLDTELPFAATAHIFCDSRAGWEDGTAELPRFAELPG